MVKNADFMLNNLWQHVLNKELQIWWKRKHIYESALSNRKKNFLN